MRRALAALLFLLPAAAGAETPAAAAPDPRDPAIREAVEAHALPRFAAFAAAADALAAEAAAEGETCGGDAFKAAWSDAFDAWISASHLRFGPTEEQERAFALSFWPDPKGFTAKALRQLSADPALVEKIHEGSIAGRGFYAMEPLLYDPDFAALPGRCAILAAQAHEVAMIAGEILADWQASRAPMLLAHDGGAYRDGSEAARELYKALDAGLQFTADVRLGRPMGTFDKPRPTRAEARLSGRSLRHVELSLASLEDLALALVQDPDHEVALKQAFEDAQAQAEALEDPVFAGVADPMGRFRVEALHTTVEGLRDLAAALVGGELQVDAGFNSLDGD